VVGPAAATLQSADVDGQNGQTNSIAVSGDVETIGVEPTTVSDTTNSTANNTQPTLSADGTNNSTSPAGIAPGSSGPAPMIDTTESTSDPMELDASATSQLEYQSQVFTVSDLVYFSYRDNTSFIGPSGNFTLDKREKNSLQLSSGVYKTSASDQYSVLVGDPVTTTVVGYYAVDENGYGLTTDTQTWIPSEFDSGSERFIVHGYYDNSTVTILNEDTNSTIWSGMLNASEHKTLSQESLPHQTHVSVKSSKPVSTLTYFDQGYYVPAKNRQFSGETFHTFAGNLGGWTNDLVVNGYAENTRVDITNTETGELIWSGVLNGSEAHNEAITEPTYITVESNKTTTVSVKPWKSWDSRYNQGLYVPSRSGSMIGDEFVEVTNRNDYLYTFAYQNDTEVSIVNEAGDVVSNYVLDKGEYVETTPGEGVWSVYSSKDISVESGYGEASAEFAPVEFGGSEKARVQGTVVSPEDPVNNATVYLLDTKDLYQIYTRGAEQINQTAVAVTKTAANGTYELSGLPPGQYAGVAVKPNGNTLQTSSVQLISVGKGETTRVSYQIEAYLTGIREELRGLETASTVALNENTDAAADVYLAGYNEFRAESAVDRATPDLFGVMMFFADAAITAASPQKAVREGIKEAAGSYAQDQVVKTAIHQSRDMAVNRFRVSAQQRAELQDDSQALRQEQWLLQFNYTANQSQVIGQGYENSTPYEEALANFEETRREGVATTEGVTREDVPEEFSRGAVVDVLQLQQRWLRGNGPVDGLTITPTGEVYRFHRTQAHQEDYYTAQLQRNRAKTGEKVSSVTATAGDAVAIFGPTPTTKVIGAGVSIVGTLGEVAFHTQKVLAEYKMSIEWANTQVHWANDADTLAQIYQENVEYVEQELEEPRTPLANGDITTPQLSGGVTIQGNQYIIANRPNYPVYWPYPAIQWQAVGNGSVTVKNTGQLNDAKARVLVVDQFDGEVSQIPSVTPGPSESPFELSESETEDAKYRYFADFHPTKPFELHQQTAYLWMEGKFTDTETTTYYVVPSIDVIRSIDILETESDTTRSLNGSTLMKSDQFRYTSTATESTSMSTGNWSKLISNATTLIDSTVSPNNDTVTTTFTVPENTSTVTFRAVGEPDTDLNLHVTDESNRHVGYDPVTGKNETQIPNSTYTPSVGGGEKATITPQSSETYTLRITGAAFQTNESSSATLIAETTPKRPPVLGVIPGEVGVVSATGQAESTNMTLAEVGEQRGVSGITVQNSTFTTRAGDRLPDNVSVQFQQTVSDLDAGEQREVPITVDASELGRINQNETRYYATMTVDTATVGSVTANASILLLDTPVENVTLSSASKNVTGAHLTPTSRLPSITADNDTRTVRANYDVILSGQGEATFHFTNISNSSGIKGYSKTTEGWTRVNTSSYENGTFITVSANATEIALTEPSPDVAYNLSTTNQEYLAAEAVTTVNTTTPIVFDQLSPGVRVDNVTVTAPGDAAVSVKQQSGVRWVVESTFASSTYNEATGVYEEINLTVAVESQEDFTVKIPVTVYKRGDVNGDGEVTLHDAVSVGKSWSNSTSGEYVWSTDIDHNSEVDMADFRVVINNYNSVSPASRVSGASTNEQRGDS
jgi:hypothetical protein